MNPILSLLQEAESQREFNRAEDKAIKLFDMQADAIRNIRTTDGYNAIKEFFRAEKEAALQRLMTTNKADLVEVQASLRVSDKFLKFLENREKDLQKLTG